MAKRITTLVLICISCLCMSARDLVFANLSTKNDADTPYIIDVKESDVPGEYVVNFQLGKLSIVPNPKQTDKELVLINGLWQNSTSGEPAVPIKNFSLAIQKDNKCSIEILSADYEEFACNLSAAEPPQVDSYEGETEIRPIKAYNGYNLSSPLDYFDIQKYRGQYIHNFKLTPISYNYQTNTVKVCKAFTAKIKADGLMTKLSARNEVFDNYTKENIQKLVIFPNEPTPAEFDVPLDEDFAIITTNDVSDELHDFIEWKETLGYHVHVFAQDNWTSDEIMECCKSAYQDFKNLTNVLIIGDNETVPSHLVKDENLITYNSYSGEYFPMPYYSDVPYTCMDGEDDYTSDYYVARIPYSSLIEVKDILHKIITYEKVGHIDSNVYNHHATCAVFAEKPGFYPHMEEDRFVRTAEEISEYGESLGYNINRIFRCKNTYVDPQKWSDIKMFGNGEDIPDNLKKPLFKWESNVEDIINAFNKGVSTFLFRYHASTISWGGFSFFNSDVRYFTNTESHPIVFSIACLTADLGEERNLAKYLIYGKSGALGVYAASAISYSGVNDVLSAGIYDAIWCNPGFKPNIGWYGTSTAKYRTKQRRVCDLLSHAYSYLKEANNAGLYYYTTNIYQYFGDPTMIFHSDKPKKIYNYAIGSKLDSNELAINLINNEPQIISFKEASTGRIERYYCKNAVFLNPVDSVIQVCISGKDILPDVKNIKVNRISSTIPLSLKIEDVKYDKATRIMEVTLNSDLEHNNTELIIIAVNSLTNNVIKEKIVVKNNYAKIDLSREVNGIYTLIVKNNGEVNDSRNILIN